MKRIKTIEQTENIGDSFEDEDEFNDSLAEYPDPLENELGIPFRKVTREKSIDFGYIDLYAEPYAKSTERVIVESQVGELDDDHIARAHKYAIDQDVTVLIYIADSFSSITRRQLSRIGENDDDLFIFGLTPTISHSTTDEVTMTFNRVISPNEWEEYREKEFPSGIDMDRAITFDHLEDKLERRELPKFKRSKAAPTHNSFHEKTDHFDPFEISYSIKSSTQSTSITGEQIDNINLKLRRKGESEELLEEIMNENESLLDSHFDSWHGLCGWGNYTIITFDKQFDTEEHEPIAQWFAETREKLSFIEQELKLKNST